MKIRVKGGRLGLFLVGVHMSERSEASIGIFDSGVGGLTVMREIIRSLPHENVVYFGDTARVPYGGKSPDTILRYALENSEFLAKQGIKLLVVACHTACSVAFHALEQKLSIPVIGIIEPAVALTVRHTKKQQIGVIGTRATIRSGVFQQRLSDCLPHGAVTAIPCPLFVPLVEENYCHHRLVDLAVAEYLQPLHEKRIDTLLLACTHYPLLSVAIQKYLGEDVHLINPAAGCAEHVRNSLIDMDLLRKSDAPPTHEFFVSEDPEKFRLLGNTFLGYPIGHVS